MKYRPEIDGLRTVAVLPVIFFHAGYAGFNGGFVGVDVFFVISGYLITSIITSELDAGTFSLLNFYERRARRILPALFFVMLCCILPALLWMMPAELKLFSQALVAVSAFSSNILFWIKSGYWSPSSELNPLLHTWSLAVEEQFYVMFPLLLMVLWRFRKRWALLSLAVIGTISLALSHWSAVQYPNFNFYSIVTRAWELAIGSVVAFFFMYRRNLMTGLQASKLLGQTFSLIGIAMIGASVVLLDRHTDFPSLIALVPTVGAALVIIFSTKQTIVGQLLASKPLVAIGLISYSAYLWHQPLFAFARLRIVSEPSSGLLLALSLMTLILAWISFHLIEKPFRSKTAFNRRQIFTYSTVAIAVFSAIGMVGHTRDGFPTRLDARLLDIALKECRQSLTFAEKNICTLSEGSKHLTILIGDSHAGALTSAMKETYSTSGLGLLSIHKNACPPVLNVYRYDATGTNVYTKGSCHLFNQALYEHITSSSEIEYVVIAARWAMGIEGTRFNNEEGGVEVSDARPHLDLIVSGRPQYHRNYEHQEQIALAYAHSIQTLLDSGKKVIIVYPIPEAGWNVPRYLFAHMPRGKSQPPPSDLASTSYEVFKIRNQKAYAALDSIHEQDGLFRLYPERFFCNQSVPGRCITQIEGKPLYLDDDHLSTFGARQIAKSLLHLYPDVTAPHLTP